MGCHICAPRYRKPRHRGDHTDRCCGSARPYNRSPTPHEVTDPGIKGSRTNARPDLTPTPNTAGLFFFVRNCRHFRRLCKINSEDSTSLKYDAIFPCQGQGLRAQESPITPRWSDTPALQWSPAHKYSGCVLCLVLTGKSPTARLNPSQRCSTQVVSYSQNPSTCVYHYTFLVYSDRQTQHLEA